MIVAIELPSEAGAVDGTPVAQVSKSSLANPAARARAETPDDGLAGGRDLEQFVASTYSSRWRKTSPLPTMCPRLRSSWHIGPPLNGLGLPGTSKVQWPTPAPPKC